MKRMPGIIQIGPVMTLGDVLAAKPGDPVPKFEQSLYQPTAKDVYKACDVKLDAHKAEAEINDTKEKADEK